MVVGLVFVPHDVSAHPGQGKKILAEKVRQLMDWTKKNRVVRTSDAMVYHFVLETPRKYCYCDVYHSTKV